MLLKQQLQAQAAPLLYKATLNAQRHPLVGVLFALSAMLMACVGYTAEVEDLSNHSQWLKLNHYHANGSGYVSEIINPDYFIAPNGQTSSQAEWQAFSALAQAYIQTGEGAEQLCNYPARLTFLEEQTSWFKAASRPECAQFKALNQPESIQSVSFVFASGYFDNPSSYYGHSLLKFNYDSTLANQRTLDASLNYGATATEGDSSTMYIIRGLTGGYEATYTRNNEFLHTNNYTNAQIRDVWDYQLKLTPQQVRFIAEHGYELQRARFKYYFFNDNCAHRIINLVELATDKKLSNTHGFWLMPNQLIDNLYQADLIESEAYVPSLKTKLVLEQPSLTSADNKQIARFFKLSATEQSAYAAEISSKALFHAQSQLDLQLAQLTLRKADADAYETLHSTRQRVLSALLARSVESVERPQQTHSNATLKDRRLSSQIQVGGIHRAGQTGAVIRYQPANNTALGQRAAGQEVSRFVMGGAEAEIFDDKVDLREFTVIDIMNINTTEMPLALGRQLSWNLRVGYNARNSVCTECHTVNVGGQVGKAKRLNDGLVLYNLVGARVHNKRSDIHDYVSLEMDNGAVIDLSLAQRVQLGLNIVTDPLRGNPEYVTEVGYAHDLGRQSDLQLNASTDGHVTALGARLGFYFN